MPTIEFDAIEPLTVAPTLPSPSERRSRYGGVYDVQLGPVAILGIEVIHNAPLGPEVHFPRGLQLDPASESRVENAVLRHYLGIDDSDDTDASGGEAGERSSWS